MQHDFYLENQAGAAFRADLNDALAALATLSSGEVAPANTYPYQLWADTASGLLKQRNGANTAWVALGALAEEGLGHRHTDQATAQTYRAVVVNGVLGLEEVL